MEGEIRLKNGDGVMEADGQRGLKSGAEINQMVELRKAVSISVNGGMGFIGVLRCPVEIRFPPFANCPIL